MNMTFEMTVYKAQNFAAKLQTKKKGWFLLFQQGFGGLITQFLMAICFAKILKEGEAQCQKQKNVKSVMRKSGKAKASARPAEPISPNLKPK